MSARGRTAPAARSVSRYSLFRLGATMAIATLLALTSTVSFAAYTAPTSLAGAATATGLQFNTAGLPDLAVAYTSSLRTSNAWVTVTNAGGLPLILNGVTVTNSGLESLAAGVQLGLWPSTTCTSRAPASAFTTTLSSGTKAIAAGYAFTVPAGGSIQLCSDTQLLTSLGSLVTQTVTSSIVFSAAATTASSWTTTDTAARDVAISAVPSSVSCAPGGGYSVAGVTYSTVVISWLEPDQQTTGYQILVNGVLVGSTNKHARSFELNSTMVLAIGPVVVTVVAIKGNSEVTTESGYILSTAGAGARNLTCA